MPLFRVELRATPDIDENEIQNIKSVGGTTAPQTIYYEIIAESKKEAEARAIATEWQFTHRRNRTLAVEHKGRTIVVDLVADVWVFGTKEILPR
jgi:hypothetical protein